MQNGFIGEIQCSRPKRLQPFRSKRRGGYTLDEKVCSFRRTHLRSDFVKRLTFNSGSFHCISDGEDPKSKEISWQRPFSTYFLFIVRSRNSCINDPIRSTSSSNAKWPVSRRWSFGDFLLRSREHFYRATCHADPGLSARPFARAGKAPHHDRWQGARSFPTSSPGPESRHCRLAVNRDSDRLRAGRPVGVQIVGPWLEDPTPLKLAELIEREFGGLVPPKMFDN